MTNPTSRNPTVEPGSRIKKFLCHFPLQYHSTPPIDDGYVSRKLHHSSSFDFQTSITVDVKNEAKVSYVQRSP